MTGAFVRSNVGWFWYSVQLLDIPPTVLFGFGRPTPPGYQGRVMHEAFQREPVLV